MTKLNLTLACGRYDRTAPLFDGEVKPEGVNLACVALPPTELFRRMIKFGEFDISEMSLSLYPLIRFKKKRFIAIPVFPFRAFFHLGILCNSKSGIKEPADLQGKRFGIPEYQMTAAVWTRGILKEEFDVSWEKTRWFIGRPRMASHADELGIRPPPGTSVSEIPSGSDLNSMLIKGEIDAMLSTPQSNLPSYLDPSSGKDVSSHPQVRKLFTHPMEEAERYYKKTGFIPLNHTIVVRERIVKDYPWVPMNLLQAFEASKRISLQRINRLVQSNLIEARTMIDEQRRIFGEDPYPYGFERNKPILDKLLGYLVDQGLVRKSFNWEEQFVESTLDR